MLQMNRRKLMQGLGVVGCSLAAHPLTTAITMASTPGDARMVVIVLRGGMDGLDVLRPVGDPMLKGLRPGLTGDAGIPLDGFYELNPTLNGLLPMWEAGDLGFVQAVSTPYRDKRSHFDGQDMLEAGTRMGGADKQRGGWLNRLLAEMPGATAETAFAIGRETPLILSGSQDYRSWAPETRLDLSPQSRLLLDLMYRDDPRFQAAAAEAMDLAEGLGMGAEIDSYGEMMVEMRNAPRRSGVDEIARFAADRLREETRIAAFLAAGLGHPQQSGRRTAPGLGPAAGQFAGFERGAGTSLGADDRTGDDRVRAHSCRKRFARNRPRDRRIDDPRRWRGARWEGPRALARARGSVALRSPGPDADR